MTRGNGAGGGWGMGCGNGPGRGRGRGRGMGKGRERGQERGQGFGIGMFHDPAPVQDSQHSGNEVESLKEQAASLMDQLQAIKAQLARLEQETSGSSVSMPVPRVGQGSPARLAVVDREQCAVCGLCVDLCSFGAISMGDVIAIDPHRCMGCGSCAEECPNGAISLLRRMPPGIGESKTHS